MNALELLVAFIQAYVFTMLSAVFIGLAQEGAKVKAEENLQSKSLRSFVEKNPGLHGIRFSMSDYRQQEWLTNYPLYSVGYIF